MIGLNTLAGEGGVRRGSGSNAGLKGEAVCPSIPLQLGRRAPGSGPAELDHPELHAGGRAVGQLFGLF